MRNSQQITELIITPKTLSAVCFTWAGLLKAGLRKPSRGGLVRNLNSDALKNNREIYPKEYF